jgi:TRAP-type C4-dicarboxylate transport system permease small subunit
MRKRLRRLGDRGSVTLILVFFCALLVGGLLIYSLADAADAIGDVYANTGSPSDAAMTYFRYAWRYLPAVIFFGLLSFLLVQLQKSKYTPGGV